MVNRSGELQQTVTPRFRGGEGYARLCDLTAGKKPQNVRVFSEMTLEKGCSIGAHTHTDDSEVIYILRGRGVYEDNGAAVAVGAGDTLIAYAGDSHSLRNESDEPLTYLAVIVKA